MHFRIENKIDKFYDYISILLIKQKKFTWKVLHVSQPGQFYIKCIHFENEKIK